MVDLAWSSIEQEAMPMRRSQTDPDMKTRWDVSSGSQDGHGDARVPIVMKTDAAPAAVSGVEWTRIEGIRSAPLASRLATIRWTEPLRTVLITKRWKTPEVTEVMIELGKWFESRGIKVFVQAEEPAVTFERFTKQEHARRIDLLVALGGDGTVLYSSHLFSESMPPTITFALGTLGFLTNISGTIQEFKVCLDKVLKGHEEPIGVTLRQRLCCKLFRNGKKMMDQVVLNEVVVDRGSSPYMTALNSYLDGEFLTRVEADGIIIASPSGSTAYNLSAGGMMISHLVPAILFTPICPHSLSFRPIAVPDSATLRIEVPTDSPTEVCAAFDGKERIMLRAGDAIEVSASPYPLPAIRFTAESCNWIESIRSKLMWNMTPAGVGERGRTVSNTSKPASMREESESKNPRPHRHSRF